MIKIYFAGSISGGREKAVAYIRLIEYASSFGNVLTEHVGSLGDNGSGEADLSDADIYERDMRWLTSADVVIAEVTVPSLGVGSELGAAERLGTKILCLFDKSETRRLSAMVAGNRNFDTRGYETLEEAEVHISRFLRAIGPSAGPEEAG